MLVKTIEYEDYDGTHRKEDHYFNLNKAELVKWLTTGGDYTLDKLLEKMTTERNGKEIMQTFEDLIHLSYGKKSLDGRRFEKSEDIWNDFYQTEAYSVLFMELITDASKAANFVNSIIPKELSNEVEEYIKNNPGELPEELRSQLVTHKQN